MSVVKKLPCDTNGAKRMFFSCAGAAAAAAAYSYTTRSLWTSTEQLGQQIHKAPRAAASASPTPQKQHQMQSFEGRAAATIRRRWNETVDYFVQPLVDSLSKRSL